MGRFEVELPGGKKVMVKKPTAHDQDEYLERFFELQQTKPEDIPKKFSDFRAYRRTLIGKKTDLKQEEINELDLTEIDTILEPYESAIRNFMGMDFIKGSNKQQVSSQANSTGQSKKA